MLIPAICAYLSVLPLVYMPITKAKHAEIRTSIEQARRTFYADTTSDPTSSKHDLLRGSRGDAPAVDRIDDPLTGASLQRSDDSPASLFRAHFSSSEWACTSAAKGRLTLLLGGRAA